MVIKSNIKKVFSYLKLLSFIESVRFELQRIKNFKKNRQFKKDNPDVILPSDFYLYETFVLDYHKAYFGGKETAEWVANHFKKYIKFQDKSILDWGCGSGRVLRHIPSFIDNSNIVYGTDYNESYATWCNENIKNVTVIKNELAPPLQFKDDFFDAIYGISIFTHLSEKMHKIWLNELCRVLKKGGVVLLTTHGNCFREKLIGQEIKLFNSGKLVEHKYKLEGNRLYASYQPPLFFREICQSSGFYILEHIKGERRNNKLQQDVWVLQKPIEYIPTH